MARRPPFTAWVWIITSDGKPLRMYGPGIGDLGFGSYATSFSNYRTAKAARRKLARGWQKLAQHFRSSGDQQRLNYWLARVKELRIVRIAITDQEALRNA